MIEPVLGAARPTSVRARLVAAALIVAIAGGIIALIGLQATLFRGGARTPYRPWPVFPAASASVDIGVTTLPLARNSWRAWSESDLESVNVFEHAIRKHVSLVMWYADWAHSEPSLAQLQAVGRRGSIPEITWEPWDALRPVRTQPKYRLRNIIAGHFDSYIRTWARTLAAYRRPVRLRFAQEMNGNWYPWSEHANGNRPGEFAQAWRHIHGIFDAADAKNVQWVWSPAAISIPPDEYPGDAYVTMVSLSVFNGGLQLRYSRWRPPENLLAHPLARLREIAPSKRIELSEIGCAEGGGSRSAWIAGMFEMLRRHPQIRSLIWYDLRKGSDWRVESSRRASAAFAAGVADQRYR